MFYLIVFGILVLLSLLNIVFPDKVSKQILLPVTALILVAIAGLRYETGGDWDIYTEEFYLIPHIRDIWTYRGAINDYEFEPGFVVLCSLIRSLGGNVQILFFIVTAFNIFLISSAVNRYTKYPIVALMAYYGILYFSLEMIYIRQAIAVALCFFACQYIEQKQLWKYIVIIALAATFHRVAVVMIPLYWLLNKRLPTWVYASVIGLGALIMLIGFPWITNIFLTVSGWLGANYAEKAEAYTETAVFATSRTLSIGFMLNLLILAALLWFKDEIDKSKYGTIHLNMFVLSLCLYYYCYELVEVSNRFRLFFLISIIVLLPLIIEHIGHWSNQLGALIVIVGYSFSFSMHIFLEQPRAAAFNPYQNYIEYKINPRPSTGKERLEKSHEWFNKERK